MCVSRHDTWTVHEPLTAASHDPLYTLLESRRVFAPLFLEARRNTMSAVSQGLYQQ